MEGDVNRDGMEGVCESQVLEELVDFLKALNNSSTDVDKFLSLEQPLRELIIVSRSSDGRAALGKLEIIRSLVDLLGQWHRTFHLCSLPDPSLNFLDVLFSLLNLGRNLCAGDSDNQDAFLDEGGVDVLVPIATTLLLDNKPSRSVDFAGSSNVVIEESTLEQLKSSFKAAAAAPAIPEPGAVDDSRSVRCLRAMLQLLANFSRRGEANQSAVWELFFPFTLLKMAALRREEICGPLCMLLYVSSESNSQRCLPLSQGDGAALIALLIASKVDGDSVAGDNSSSANSSSAKEQIDWLELLMQQLCLQTQLFPLLFINLGNPGLRQKVDMPILDSDELLSACRTCLEASSLTGLQVRLMYILCDCLTSQEGEFLDSSGTDNADELPGVTPLLPLMSMYFLVDILRKAANSVPKVSHVPTLVSAASANVQILAFALCLLRICFASDFNFGARKDVTSGLLSHGLVDLLLDLLQALGPPEGPGNRRTRGEPLEDRARRGVGPLPQTNLYLGYRRDIVAVIANASHRNILIQDRIREKGGLLLVLQQSNVDEENPYLREWGLWAVRNLTEGNEKNRQEIASLEIKEPLNLPELQRMGLNVQIDPITRRPRLYNDTSGPSHT